MKDNVIGVIGLGYVGLPLAIEFGKQYKTVGFDLDERKIQDYQSNIDTTGQVSSKDFELSKHLAFTSEASDLGQVDIYVVCVPTPVRKGNIPNLELLERATKMVSEHLSPSNIVIYESTVYPGATEEVCVPILENFSNLEWKKEFNVGYSPERINPGDKVNTITTIQKVVSADTAETLDVVAELYGSIISKGVYRATSIKTAEAAKVIENTQRDLNIALMNELSIIFAKMDINTKEVLDTAATKWNFMRFEPGLVGGHCIGVDPYYLTYKAQMIGYHPEVILAGRRINDSMSRFVAEKTVKLLIKKHHRVKDANIIVLGATFKENCSDIRNSKVFDLISSLREYGCNIYLHDPIASSNEIYDEYGVNLVQWNSLPKEVEAIILAVPHREYLEMSSIDLKRLLRSDGVVIDIKSKLSDEAFVDQDLLLWQL